MIRKSDKIFVAGHKGLIGSAILRKLRLNGYKNIIVASKNKLNLISDSSSAGLTVKGDGGSNDG